MRVVNEYAAGLGGVGLSYWASECLGQSPVAQPLFARDKRKRILGEPIGSPRIVLTYVRSHAAEAKGDRCCLA